MLTAGIFCFVHSQAVRRKSDITHQDVKEKSKAKAIAFIQGKTEAHLLRKLIVHDSLKNVKFCIYSLLYFTV